MKVAEDRAMEQERRRGRSGKGSESSALWECEKWVSEVRVRVRLWFTFC